MNETEGEAPSHPDQLLQLFIQFINNSDSEVGITLLVGGSWLTGNLVSPRKWAEGMSEFVRFKAADGHTGGLDGAVEHLGRIFFPTEAEIDHYEEELRESHPARSRPDEMPRFAHLLDGMRYGTDMTPLDGAPLRVRLEHVTTWTFGTLQSDR